MFYVEITKQIDELTEEQFRFALFDSPLSLILDSYALFTKETKRHKHKVVKRYGRLDRKDFTFNQIEESQVPLTEEIKKEALDKLIGSLKVQVWSEYKN